MLKHITYASCNGLLLQGRLPELPQRTTVYKVFEEPVEIENISSVLLRQLSGHSPP